MSVHIEGREELVNTKLTFDACAHYACDNRVVLMSTGGLDLLDESNAAVLEGLAEAETGVKTHRAAYNTFIVCADPDEDNVNWDYWVQLAESFEDYPVLDEDHLGQLEWEQLDDSISDAFYRFDINFHPDLEALVVEALHDLAMEWGEFYVDVEDIPTVLEDIFAED